MTKRVLITGLGFVTSIGNDQAAVTKSLRGLTHGIESVRFLDRDDLPVKVAGTVKGFNTESLNWRDWTFPAQFPLVRDALRSVSPHGLYGLCAVTQAAQDAGLALDDLRNEDTGLYCASAGSPRMLANGINQLYETNGRRGDPMGILRSISGTLNFNLSAYFGIQGTNCGYVSACTSSSHAAGYAFDDVALGRQERAIVVGAEEMTAESILPFSAMRALSNNPDPGTASRPFDRRRDGFVGAGGAVALILESEESARRRGATVYAEFAGWGQAADGFSVASPHPDGLGLSRAMARALRAAGVEAAQIDYVNAHATSTPIGDRAEALAIRRIFGTGGQRPHVSSTKALTGHSLSMAGALEAAICALAMRDGFIPGCAHLEEPDPACDGLSLPRATLPLAPAYIVNNSSGFGGVNVCHVLRRWEAQ